jgi:hypothetical protein
MYHGTVKRYLDNKGYGFLNAPYFSHDVYLHITGHITVFSEGPCSCVEFAGSHLMRTRLSSPAEKIVVGDQLVFTLGRNRNGIFAQHWCRREQLVLKQRELLRQRVSVEAEELFREFQIVADYYYGRLAVPGGITAEEQQECFDHLVHLVQEWDPRINSEPARAYATELFKVVSAEIAEKQAQELLR